MICISKAISNAEMLLLKKDLNILYPTYKITKDQNQQLAFMVVADDEFSGISSKNVPILTPISIHQMIEKKIDPLKFTFPHCGLKNLHLFLKKVFFSGFGSSKNQLKEMCKCMGAVIEHIITRDTDLLIAKSYKSEIAQVALSFKIPIIQDKYIYELFNSQSPINPNDYKLPLFAGMLFTTSCLSSNENDNIKETIISNGGNFSASLQSNTSLIVSKQLQSSRKLKCTSYTGISTIIEDLRTTFDTPQSLCKTIAQPLIVSDLFNGSTFYLSPKINPHLSFDLSQLIQQNQGQIIQTIETANYIILMDLDNDNFPNSQAKYIASLNNEQKLLQRTPIWVERCIQEEQILHPSEFLLFTPTKTSRRINTNYYVSITGFDRSDYLQIISSLKWLNIKFSPLFKKSMTHLIAKEHHSSKKTEAAKRWSIPIVNIDWLFKVADGSLTSVPLSNPPSQKAPTPISNQNQNQFIELSDETDDAADHPQTPIPNTNSVSFLDDDNDDVFDESVYEQIFPKKVTTNGIIIESKPMAQTEPSNKSINSSPPKLQQSPKIQSPKKLLSYLSDSSSDDDLFSLVDTLSNNIGTIDNQVRPQSSVLPEVKTPITIFSVRDQIESSRTIPAPPIHDSPLSRPENDHNNALQSKEITPPPTSLIHKQVGAIEIEAKPIQSRKSVVIPQEVLNKGKPVLKTKQFLDDSDDDASNFAEKIEKDQIKNIEEATKSIRKGINRKKVKKARKRMLSVQNQDQMTLMNDDYEFDSLESFTQRPSLSDEEEFGSIGYEEVQNEFQPVHKGKGDFLLSLLQE